MNNETKVGLLVVVALAALGWLSVKSGSFGMGAATGSMRDLSSIFNDVEGIKAGSPVKMAGVDVGEVVEVRLQPNGSAVLSFKVKEAVALPADVTAQITTSGLIGERYVSLVAGPEGAQGKGGLLPSSVKIIASSGAADTQQMGNNFAKVADDLSAMTTTLRQVLGTPENAEKLQQIIDGMASFSNNVGGDSGRIIQDIGKVAANFAKISDDLANGKGMLGQMLKGDASGAGGLGDLAAAAREFREVMAKVNSGQGTLGKLVNDPQTAEKINNALDTLGSVSERLEQFRTEVAFEGYSMTNEDGVGNGSFNVTLQPRPTRFYALGITADGMSNASREANDRNGPYAGKDFGSRAKITAQFGHVFQDAVMGQDLAVRVGLKNSTGGVGVDTHGKVLGKNVKYSADVYDFGGSNTPGSSSPHVDVAARADLIGNTVYGVVGYDNMLNQEYGSPIVGVGMKFQDDDLKYIVGGAL